MLKKLMFFFLFFFISLTNVFAEEVNLYLFYSKTCSTCAKEKVYLEELKGKYDYLNVIMYEVTENEDNNSLMKNVKEALKEKDIHVPYTVIGTMGLIGFNDTIASQMEDAIIKYNTTNHVDIVYAKQNNLNIDYKIDYPEGNYNLPILGDVNPKEVSLPLISIIIGLVDGFNPCAMWVLIFLISMLFNMKNRKRMWILGLTFLVTSALVYLVFMMSWLQVAISLTSIKWFRYIISLIALIGGYINISSYIKSLKEKDGCHVVDSNKRKKIFDRIRKFTSEKSIFIALLGIIGLAVSVNLIELACSSGLPLIYTQILALNDLSSLQHFLYICLYVLFFLFDDIMIFFIAMKTLEISGISTKYTKYSHLIGGIIMLLIAILMTFKPEWLMFNF